MDFSDDVYGKNITVYFIKKMRDIVKFDSPNDLKRQLDKDEKELFLHTFVIQFMLMFQTTRLSLLILDITQKLSLNSKN